MLISSFLPSTGGQGSEQGHFSSTVRQMSRILWSRPLCMIIMTKTMQNKSKKQFQHAVRIGFSCSNTNTYTNNIFSTGWTVIRYVFPLPIPCRHYTVFPLPLHEMKCIFFTDFVLEIFHLILFITVTSHGNTYTVVWTYISSPVALQRTNLLVHEYFLLTTHNFTPQGQGYVLLDISICEMLIKFGKLNMHTNFCISS